MDPSVQFLMGRFAPTSRSATIHPITPAATESIDDDKIGFTLDVAVRLDRDRPDDSGEGVVVAITEAAPSRLADSA